MSNNEMREKQFAQLLGAWIKLLLFTSVFSLLSVFLTIPKPGWEIYRVFLAPGMATLVCAVIAVFLHFTYPKDKL